MSAKRRRRSGSDDPPPRSVSRIFCDESADVHLISSAGSILKVHSFYLMAASPVFRHMLEGADQHPPSGVKIIELPDLELENAPALEDLMTVITGKFTPSIMNNRPRCWRLIRLAQKYDCQLVLDLLKGKVYERLSDPDADAHHLFLYAANMDDARACHLAIPIAAKLFWDQVNSGEEGAGGEAGQGQGQGFHADGMGTRGLPLCDKNVEGESCLDPTAMSLKEREYIPPRYFDALLRAWRRRGRGTGGDGNWQAVADEFYRQVTGGEKPPVWV